MFSLAAARLVAATINSLPTQPIPRRRRRLSETEVRAFEAFLRAYAVTSQALEREAASRRGLPLGEHFLLVQIGKGPQHGTRPSELAARSHLTRSGVTRAIDRLVTDGLVERRVCPGDGRGQLLVLTARGRHLLKRAAPSHMRAIAEHFADPLSVEELAVVTHALERIAASE